MRWGPWVGAPAVRLRLQSWFDSRRTTRGTAQQKAQPVESLVCLIVLTQSFQFADPRDLADLRTFATRAKTIDDGAIRLQAAGPVLAAYVCVLRPRLLGESTPTILGLRTMALAQPAGHRCDSAAVRGPGPAGPGRGGRRRASGSAGPPSPSHGPASARRGPAGNCSAPSRTPSCGSAAEAGISEVAGDHPGQAGRADRQQRPGARLGPGTARRRGLPAGAAFAALTLGFLADGEQRLYRAGRWFRLSGTRGHVLVRTGTGL